jgi:hypothetical protein
MDPKLLTEKGWKEIAQKFKIKDNGLQDQLAQYEDLEDDQQDDCLKAITSVSKTATDLKRDKDVAALPVVVKYLTNLVNAAQAEQRDLVKAIAEAKKNATAAQKQAEAEAKKRDAEDEDEEAQGDSFEKLKKALQALKLSKNPYYFLVCDAKPYGLVVSKKDITKSIQHRKELAQMAGGSTRPPKFGECRFEGTNKLTFEMEKPLPGLARILQKWIKDATGLGLKVTVGTETSDDEGETPA